MTNLLSLMKRDIRVARLTPLDVSTRTDSFVAFRDLVIQSEEKYPRISRWLETRVFSELGSNSRRVALLVYDGDAPAASAILKVGDQTKICHLRIGAGYAGKRLGDLLFSLMVIQAAPIARSIHFTLPETLWHEQGGFFQTFGFRKIDRALRQYRSHDEELVSVADFSDVWRSTLTKLPRLVHSFSISGSDVKPSIMLSIRPRYAERILRLKKRVEIRTRFSKRWIGHRASIYATSPVCSIVGEADIESIDCKDPNSIWRDYSEFIGCTREEFEAYTHGRSSVFAIELANVLPYESVVRFDALGSKNLFPPQAYSKLIDGSPLTMAAMTASLLHASAAPGGG